MGKHEELINTCPIYKEIKISQLGGEEEWKINQKILLLL